MRPCSTQVRLSKIFQWYKVDFGSDNEEVTKCFSVSSVIIFDVKCTERIIDWLKIFPKDLTAKIGGQFSARAVEYLTGLL